MKDFNLIQSAFKKIRQDNTCFRVELSQVCTVRRLFFGESEFKIVDESSIDEVFFAEGVNLPGDGRCLCFELCVFRDNLKIVELIAYGLGTLGGDGKFGSEIGGTFEMRPKFPGPRRFSQTLGYLFFLAKALKTL